MTNSKLRRSGGLVALQWSGDIPDPTVPAFAETLGKRRFRTIENAASEEISIGWITPEDPSGSTHAIESMSLQRDVAWMRARVDRKRLPADWVRKHLQAATVARGKALSARERREMKDDLMESLLPRVLPSTSDLDAIVHAGLGIVLLFSTSKQAREMFARLWFETFSVPLDLVGPLQMARRMRFDDGAINQLNPTRWPKAGATA